MPRRGSADSRSRAPNPPQPYGEHRRTGTPLHRCSRSNRGGPTPLRRCSSIAQVRIGNARSRLINLPPKAQRAPPILRRFGLCGKAIETLDRPCAFTPLPAQQRSATQVSGLFPRNSDGFTLNARPSVWRGSAPASPHTSPSGTSTGKSNPISLLCAGSSPFRLDTEKSTMCID
jgi:hypothetical protein